jgi:hypothetical protein
MPVPKGIARPKQLVVEGRDAEGFFQALLNHMGLTDVQTQDFGGISELRGFLKALRNMPGFLAQVTSLGIVRDAETNAAAAFQSVCSALSGANLAVPAQVMVPVGHSPQVSVLILPDAATPGMLETICFQAVGHDPVIECVEQYFECVEQRMGSRPGNVDKARVQAFLASRPKPSLRLREAAHAGYWPWDSPTFDHVKQFLLAL